MSTALRTYIRQLEYTMTLMKSELEACSEKNWKKRTQIEEIIQALNTPNTGDEFVVQKVITILNLEMDSQNGWVKRVSIDSDSLRISRDSGVVSHFDDSTLNEAALHESESVDKHRKRTQ